MPGVTGRSKRRRHSPICKASALFGAQVPRGGEAHPGERGERSSSSHGRTAVERTSVFVGTHPLFAGWCGKRSPGGNAPRVRAERVTRCTHNAREGPPLVAVRARRMRCAESVREGASRHRKTARTLARVGPVPQARFFGSVRLRGSSARAVLARGRTTAKALGGSSPPAQHEEHDAARGECPCVVVLQKSAERPRAQRSASSVPHGSKAPAAHEGA